MEVIVFQRERRIKVEALHVEDAVDQSLLVHGRDLAGDAAEGEPAVDLSVKHFLPQEARRRQRRTAAAHLHGEAVVEIAGRFDDVRSGLGDQQLLRVLGVARRAGHDTLRVADVVGQNDVVHVVFRDCPRRVRIGHQMVRDNNNVLGVFCVRSGVAERTAGNAALVVAAVAVGIAVGVAGRRAEERHVDMQLSAADGGGAASVRPEHDRAVDQTA